MKKKVKTINERPGFENVEVLYRYYDHPVYSGSMNLDGDFLSGGINVGINLQAFRILRFTPQGVWINLGHRERFVNLRKNKKYAFKCVTTKEALESFLARKAKQISILKSQLDMAVLALKKGKEKAKEEFPGSIQVWLREENLFKS
jgi:hypothetical protein